MARIQGILARSISEPPSDSRQKLSLFITCQSQESIWNSKPIWCISGAANSHDLRNYPQGIRGDKTLLEFWIPDSKFHFCHWPYFWYGGNCLWYKVEHWTVFSTFSPMVHSDERSEALGPRVNKTIPCSKLYCGLFSLLWLTPPHYSSFGRTIMNPHRTL